MNRQQGDDGSGIPDSVLDQALREVLDVEPPSNLRARVLTRIDASPSRVRWMWAAVPVAAAIVLVVLLLPRSNDAQRPGHVAGRPVAPPPPIAAPVNPVTAQAVGTDSQLPAEGARKIHAAAVNEAPPDSERAVDALNQPAPLAMPNIDEGRATPMTSIQVIPIGVKPLDVDALNDSPQERH